ncbi:hypothetical protein [Hoeflea sp.]|uniref:hypothetical protein n=1 Tax=Hoeflea sp. TaxID=1940281 RepID=UPI0019B993EE|nr:hypothetical protein [Hoeflea sp.]MBC7286097.1 hypothetical protein [Hoeflea sp.]
MVTLHPAIAVQLTGYDGNAFMILGLCQKAARRAGLSEAKIDAFTEEATTGDYDHLIRTAMLWFNCT